MAAAELPKWGFGQSPKKIQPVSDSFILFFSSDAQATSMPWSADLSAPIPISRQPAWSRIPIQRHSSTEQSGQIMKRVGLCTRRRLLDSSVAKSFKTPAPEPQPDADEVALAQDMRRIRRRTLGYKPAQGETGYSGEPSSEAKIVNLMMLAKVDVTNYYMTTSTDTRLADKMAARRGTLVQVVPMKRYAEDDIVDVPTKLVRNGGNKLSAHDQVLPIIKRHMVNNQGQVTLESASIAEALYTLHQMGFQQRQPSNNGPRLSDITDYTEPPTPATIPRVVDTQARSPQKRSDSKLRGITSPIKKLFTKGVLKLVPGSSPKASPSPTKSDSAPSTPIQMSPNPSKPAITPSGIDSTPLARFGDHDELFEQLLQQTTPQPGRTFRAPSYFDSSSFGSSTQVPHESSPSGLSPMKHYRPVAPTPSRWNRAEPTTPQASTPTPGTPAQSDSPIRLAALAPLTPQLPQSAFTPQSAKSADLDFGTVSPSFNSSIAWMNDSVEASEPQRIKNVNKARRRQSEPLLRKYFKDKARRCSSSPRKVRFQEQDIFRDDVSIGSLFDTSISTPVKSASPNVDATELAEDVSEPEATMDVEVAQLSDIEESTEPEAAMDVEYIPAQLSVIEEVTEPLTTMDVDATITAPAEDEHKPTTAIMDVTASAPVEDEPKQTPTHLPRGPPRNSEGPIINIDMRQNPDIFRTQVSSPPFPVFSLSRMADDRLQGHANVVVTEENGRLFVRFKLSAEYAHMFPASQGFDSSRFSMTPSAISSSPRISFKTHQPISQELPASSPSKATQTPARTAPQDLLSLTTPGVENTPSHLSPTPAPHSISSMLRTPNATGLAMDHTVSDTPDFRTPELPENTLIFGTPNNGLTPTQTQDVRGTTGLGIVDGSNQTPVFKTPQLPAQATRKVTGADETLAMSWSDLPASTPSQKVEPTTPMQATPKVTGADETLAMSWSDLPDATPSQMTNPATPMQADADDTLAMTWNELPANTPSQMIEPATPMQADADDTLAVNWNELPVATPSQVNPSPAATPKTSFTPVNQPTPRIQVTEASGVETTPAQTLPAEVTPAQTTDAGTTPTENQAQDVDTCGVDEAPNNTTPAEEAAPTQTADSRQDYDSPGREYMREFIKRSRQTTTTETGSPMAPVAKRQPLEARSPNRGSPQKNKRKHDGDGGEGQSPAKKAKPSTEDSKPATPKRARRTKTSRQKTELAIEMTDLPTAVEETAETVKKQSEVAEAEGPVTRRSTRLRSQGSGAPKSSIPTPIKLTRSGAGRNGGAVLNSNVRSEQQDLTHQTRLNTKRNKGNAEYPAQVLAKQEAGREDDSDGSAASGESSGKGKKAVGWREPLESVQEAKPKKGRAGKAKVTQGKTGVAKPTTQKKRASKAAEELGMVGNGTPVKPQRMTRARTRSQA